jgi:hypothetical protein
LNQRNIVERTERTGRGVGGERERERGGDYDVMNVYNGRLRRFF